MLDAAAATFEQVNGDVRITSTVLGEQPGKQRVAAQQRQAQAQFAARQLAQVIEFVLQLLAQAQHGFAAFEDDLAGGGQVQL
ncbi:hypothetical protein D3C80_1053830 [compost metagenome]